MMKKLAHTLLIALTSCLLYESTLAAQDYERYVPQELPPQEWREQSTETIAQKIEQGEDILVTVNLKGIVVCKDISQAEEAETVTFIDIDVPGGGEKLKKCLAEQFIGRALTIKDIARIKQQIVVYYRNHNRPVILVEVPEQDISNGILKIALTEGQLGKVSSYGNKWFSDKLFTGRMHLKPGETINSKVLMDDVAWMNQNPFHHTDVVFAPGEEVDTTDIELVTKDRLPLRLYAGVDDTGTEFAGRNRWFTGFNWTNAFGLDHRLAYQYTTSSNFHRFQGHTADYVAPLPWHHTLFLFGGYYETHPHIASFFHNHGTSSQASLRYQIPFKPLFNATFRELAFGFDYKRTNNNLSFLGENTVPVVAGTVNLTQVMGSFNFAYESKIHYAILEGQLFFSPGDWLPDQSNHDFEELRAYAKNHYVYGRLRVSDEIHLPKNFSIFGEVRGQLASENLLQSEQFGLGGWNTVRGYEERQLNFDNALVANVELRTPQVSILKLFNVKKHDDAFYLLGFFDYGLGGNHKLLPKEQESQWLMSAGPGVRYTIGRYLTARADYGFEIHHLPFGPEHHRKLHFGLVVSY